MVSRPQYGISNTNHLADEHETAIGAWFEHDDPHTKGLSGLESPKLGLLLVKRGGFIFGLSLLGIPKSFLQMRLRNNT